MSSEKNRLAHVTQALSSPAIQDQFTSWELQRDVLRETLNSIYGDAKEFQRWWLAQKDDVRLALVMASLEDLQFELDNSASPDGGVDSSEDPATASAKQEFISETNTAFRSLIDVVCPEIHDVPQLLQDSGALVVRLLEALVICKENSNFLQLIQSFENLFRDDELPSNTNFNAESSASNNENGATKSASNQPGKNPTNDKLNLDKTKMGALMPLKAVRSCILLQFALNIFLIYDSQKDEVL